MAKTFDTHLRSLGRNKRRDTGKISKRAISYLRVIEKIRAGLLEKYRRQGKTLKEAEALIEKRIEERRKALLEGY
ncbi:MAG: hypothetical protein HYW05_01890 [Candidatus Diapherotrites archaeon]|nr:hypothetical protein [Candidatus Diapherotrites archaeon]